jgi:phage gpG-like protein
MAVAMSVSLSGEKKLERLLRRVDPKRDGVRWQRAALVRSGLKVQSVAAEKKIERGGPGPPLPDRLTSRTGTLRRSIRVDRGELPTAIEIGTDLVYGAVHELGSRTHPKRPFLAPALQAVSKDFSRIWVEEIEKVLGSRL